MKCAIITCSECNKKLFSKPYQLNWLSLPSVNENILIVNLAFTPEKFYLLSKKKKEKIAEAISRELRKFKVYCVYLSGITDCSEFSQIKHIFYYPDGKALLRKYAGIGACILAAQCNFSLSDAKIAIYQEHFNQIGFEILCDFSQYFKNITLIGKSPNNLKECVDQLMDHCGLCANTSEKLSSSSNCDFLFLLDEINNASFSEKTVIIDLTKTHSFYCLNTAKFELPSGFNKILPYFNLYDDICIEFILCLIDSNSLSKEETFKAIRSFGGIFKTFCAKSKIMLDKQ